MNRQDDYIRFTQLIALLNEMSGKSREITEETIEGYFQALKDLDYEQIEMNGYVAIRTKGFFPLVADLAGNKNDSAEAQDAYARLEKAIISHSFMYARKELEASLTRTGFEHLIPILDQWAEEIATTQNKTNTRAQFIGQYKGRAEMNRIRQLKGQYQKALPENIVKQINDIGH